VVCVCVVCVWVWGGGGCRCGGSGVWGGGGVGGGGWGGGGGGGGGWRKRYEYIKRLTVFLLVIGISGKIGRVKRKGNEAPNTLVGNERERHYMKRWE